MQTNPLRLSFLALVASVALSCAALGGCSSEAPSPTPATVHLRLDSSAARTVRVPLTGGTITALGQDGTRFTLTIPDHALVDETEMTLTPVEAVEGLPFSRGFGGAVQLSPDGLRLFAHATLSVQPARPLLPTEQVFFGWAGEGADLHLVPSTDGVTMKLLHFSGYGIAGAAPGERRATASPSDVEAQLEQEVAVLFAEERNRHSSIDYMFHKGACNPFNDAEHTDVHTSWGNAGGERAAARGLAPSLEADTLTGSNTEERQIDGMPTAVTLTWWLRRGS